jgi:hypothetical protein
MSNGLHPELTSILTKVRSGSRISANDLQILVDASDGVLDFDELLPMSFKLDGKPMDVKNRRPMFRPLFTKKRKARRTIFLCGRQIGKLLDLDTKIVTPSGWTTVGEIKIGETIISEDGTPTKVIGLSPITYDKKCYKITFDDGSVVTACSEHLWKVSCPQSGRHGKPRIVTTEEWMKLQPKKKKDRRFSIPATLPLELPEQQLPINPYVLGYWLSDGDSSGGRITCGQSDLNECLNQLQKRGVTTGPVSKDNKSHSRYFSIKGLTSLLSSNDLKNNKHIPLQYLRSSYTQRLELLRGLMDTDGSVRKTGGCEITQKRKDLAQQIQELLSTLGIKSRLNLKTVKPRAGNSGGDYWTVGFATQLSVFSMPRKSERHAQATSGNPKNTRHYAVSFEEVPSRPMRCIKVDHPSSMFLCGDSMIPTHNTASEAGSMMMDLNLRKNFRIMYATPMSIFTNRMHHVYMNPMQSTTSLPWKIQNSSCVNNVNEKTFTSGGHYYGISMFSNPKQAIGLAIDSILFDEVQDMVYDLIPYARETLGTSNYRWESYLGTARSVDNTIQTLFDQSSQNEWHMRCTYCGHVNVPVGDDGLKMVQPVGIGCANCSTESNPKLLDVNAGWWQPTYPDREEKFRGFHVPQIIVKDRITPHDRYLDTIYDKLHGVSKYSLARFQQEIMGISSEQGGRPITLQQIRDSCTLNQNDIRLEEYSCITGGADWGGSEITSFTVGALVGLHYTGKFHCLGAIRPTGIQDNYRHLPLADFFRRKAGSHLRAIGADAGFVGSVQNPNLGAAAGVPCASISYGSLRTFYKASGGRFNLFNVDRSTIIYAVFSSIIEGHLIMPSDPAFETYWTDLLAVTAEDIDTPTGTIRRYARVPSKADDFVHALGYALFMCSIMSGNDLLVRLGLQSNTSLNRAGMDSIGTE